MGSMIMKALLKYIEKNPEVVEELVGALIKKLIDEMKGKEAN